VARHSRPHCRCGSTQHRTRRPSCGPTAASTSIGTVNVLVQALDSGVLPDEGQAASTKDFTAALPSAVKNQALRDARSVWRRSVVLGVIPVLRKPLCKWNKQNWRLEGETLVLSVCSEGTVRQIAVRRR